MSGIVTRLGEFSLPWYELRASTATTADEALALGTNEAAWASKPTTAVNVPEVTGGKVRTVEIIGWGTDTANYDFEWHLYAYRSLYSPAVRVATGKAILGAADVVTSPVDGSTVTSGFYVDTWGKTTDYWDTGVTEQDDAGDSVSILRFDLRGYQYIFFGLDLDGGAGTQVVTAALAFSGY